MSAANFQNIKMSQPIFLVDPVTRGPNSTFGCVEEEMGGISGTNVF